MDRGMPAVPSVEPAGQMSLKGGEGGPRGTELLGLGIFLAGAFVGPLLAGLVIDGVLHTSPLFLFVGVVVGIGAASVGLYTRIKRYL